LALKADNPVDAYKQLQEANRIGRNGDDVDELENKDWLRAT